MILSTCYFVFIAHLREIDEVLGLFRDLLSEGALIIWSKGVAENLHFGLIVESWYGLHEMRGGVVAEVRGDIANSQSTTTVKQSLWVSKRSTFE